jgi:L-ascorbate metabolism protein UlaG (beta-lactamase superfamily)
VTTERIAAEPATVMPLGGPTMLLEVGGWRILTDPTFDPPGRRYSFGWGTASTKTSGPVRAVADLEPIDVVLLTHDHHADNLDDSGRALLDRVPVVITTVAGARRLGGGGTRGLAEWEVTRLEADGRSTIEVTATPCRHGPRLSRPIVGDVVGFALVGDALPEGAWWITGDTVLYDRVLAVANRFSIELAIVHLGGVRFPITGPLHYTMTLADGIELVRRVSPRVALATHYEGWSHFRDPRQPIDRVVDGVDRLDVRLTAVAAGTRVTADELAALVS